MATKGMKLVKNVKFIEKCKKNHVCYFCAKTIDIGSYYFNFEKYIQYDNGKRTYIKGSPQKCCFSCFPEKHPKFREEEKIVPQMTLEII